MYKFVIDYGEELLIFKEELLLLGGLGGNRKR
jgi:hypothetical protein